MEPDFKSPQERQLHAKLDRIIALLERLVEPKKPAPVRPQRQHEPFTEKDF